jgi:hypothetical protein
VDAVEIADADHGSAEVGRDVIEMAKYLHSLRCGLG